MNYEEVKQLLDAGFTADEIRGFFPQNPQNNTQETKPEHSTETIVKDSEKDPAPGLDQARTPADQENAKPENTNIPGLDSLNQNISKLIRTLQVSNLRSNSVQSQTEPDITKQVDDIMSSIIRPEHKKGEVV